MKLLRRSLLRLAAAAVALPAVSQALWAQAYPARPITMIVPASAGGPTDAIGRIMAERMRASLGQTIVIENVSGAGGSIGVGRVARAAPDGYTIGIGHWTHYVLNGAIYSLPYDLLKDFEPVAMIATGPLVIVAKKTLPANDLKQLAAWLKANPEKALAGTGGVGTPPHVAGLLFQKITGSRFQFVPYRGTGPAMLDLVAGQIDIMLEQASNVIPQLRGGTIKAFAVTAKTRLASAPDVPTVEEAGVPDFYISVWHGLWAPKGMPRDAVARLNAAVLDALADPATRRKLAELAQELPPPEQQTPEALGAYQRAEIEKWWPIVKEPASSRNDRPFDAQSRVAVIAATPALAAATGRSSETPVICAGFGRPISASKVGARSASRPSANATSPPPISSNGTGPVVWDVCGPPVTGSRIISQLPWSAVTSRAPPALRIASAIRPSPASTVSTALMAAGRLPVWPTMSGLA
jgi:tripartite-type tricarboxylate transporter receptor subunit TctC